MFHTVHILVTHPNTNGTVTALRCHCGGIVAALWRHCSGILATLSRHSGGITQNFNSEGIDWFLVLPQLKFTYV
jgi:hypothetical protein